tara:strand:+ start:325 stop:549 length:225 start_codon:yes stop_codon:yes gene_type:complete
MSFEIIVKKVLTSMKDEIKKEKNIEIINSDIIHPIVDKVIDHIYPYFIGASIVFVTMFMVIFIILFLNLKICYF